MQVKLTVIAGPHEGKEFLVEEHDTFLVGRSKEAHFQLPKEDPYFSRRQFLVEIHPPRVRMLDLNSRNGTFVNGTKTQEAELHEGDEIKAGHTVIRVAILGVQDEDATPTRNLPNEPGDIPRPLETTGAPARPNFPSIPGFLPEEEIGRGAMGIVYRALRQSDGLTVAVKTIQPARGTSVKQRAKFLREAQILRDLHHANIVRYLDSGDAGDYLYLAMEFVAGTDAYRLLQRQGMLDIRRGVKLICQVLNALRYAHAQGFVHRDIKPSNILLERGEQKWRVKLADFGLARAYQASALSGLTMQGEVGGTLAFMPPEQITHFRNVSPAADQYSAAATLYNLLTAKYVFDLPDDPKMQMRWILTQDQVPIRQRRPEIPEGLADVIERALAMDPEERFGDVEEFREALMQFAR